MLFSLPLFLMFLGALMSVFCVSFFSQPYGFAALLCCLRLEQLVEYEPILCIGFYASAGCKAVGVCVC